MSEALSPRSQTKQPMFRIIVPSRPTLLIAPTLSCPSTTLLGTELSTRLEAGQSPSMTLRVFTGNLTGREGSKTFINTTERGRNALKLSALRTLSSQELNLNLCRTHHRYGSGIKIVQSPLHLRPARREDPRGCLHKSVGRGEAKVLCSRMKQRRRLKIDMSGLSAASISQDLL
jgi:hypothetical protein